MEGETEMNGREKEKMREGSKNGEKGEEETEAPHVQKLPERFLNTDGGERLARRAEESRAVPTRLCHLSRYPYMLFSRDRDCPATANALPLPPPPRGLPPFPHLLGPTTL
ncbi:hypothetical protein ACLOJK_003339, partial [Asimina triloba]